MMMMIVAGLLLIVLGAIWYPVGFYIISLIDHQPPWLIDFILSYKNQECWLIIVSGIMLFGKASVQTGIR